MRSSKGPFVLAAAGLLSLAFTGPGQADEQNYGPFKPMPVARISRHFSCRLRS